MTSFLKHTIPSPDQSVGKTVNFGGYKGVPSTACELNVTFWTFYKKSSNNFWVK